MGYPQQPGMGYPQQPGYPPQQTVYPQQAGFSQNVFNSGWLVGWSVRVTDSRPPLSFYQCWGSGT